MRHDRADKIQSRRQCGSRHREAFHEESNNRHCSPRCWRCRRRRHWRRASRRSSSAASSTCPGFTPISPAPGSETAAKMAVEDFGGEVLGRKVEIVAADHLNKADLAANIARDMLDNQGVEMLYDVAASATALAAGEIAKARNKIVMYSTARPRSGSATRPAVPTPCIMSSTPLGRPTSPGSPPSSRASTPGSSSPPTMRSARIWKRTPPMWW